MIALSSCGELTINGQVHLRARDYTPSTGTFTKRDPLGGFDGTTTVANPYHYTNNNPLNLTDATGLSPTSDNRIRLASYTPQPVCAAGAVVPPPPDGAHKTVANGGIDDRELNEELGDETWYERGDDYIRRDEVNTGINYARHSGWEEAADHLQHYLDRNGDPISIDIGKAASDVPQFKANIANQLRRAAKHAVDQAIANGNLGCPQQFQSGWEDWTFEQGMNMNWFVAVASCKTAVTGYVVVTAGDPSHVHIAYQSHIHDRYNFDPGKHTEIPLPLGRSIDVTDEQMHDLVRANLAREYDMDGSSAEATADYGVGDSNWSVRIDSPSPSAAR